LPKSTSPGSPFVAPFGAPPEKDKDVVMPLDTLNISRLMNGRGRHP
jgi:hypothetical protein